MSVGTVVDIVREPLLKRIAELEARVEELEVALAPFAHRHDAGTKLHPEDWKRAFDALVYR